MKNNKKVVKMIKKGFHMFPSEAKKVASYAKKMKISQSQVIRGLIKENL